MRARCREVLELPLHVLGSCVVRELESLEEGDGRAEVGEVAPFERAQGSGFRNLEMNEIVESSCSGLACRSTMTRMQMTC